MLRQLAEAALTCRAATFSNARAQFDYIRRGLRHGVVRMVDALSALVAERRGQRLGDFVRGGGATWGRWSAQTRNDAGTCINRIGRSEKIRI
jgi:hypothetical protein